MPAVWRDRNAALFVGVSLVSGFGSTAMSLTAGVWVKSLTGSSSLAALAGFCVFAPTLAGPLLGAVVDRLPRQRLLIGTNLAMAAALLVLFAVRSAAEVWLVYAVMLGYGVTHVLLDAGEAALLPAALPAAALGEVNGTRMSAQEGTKLIAPLAGAGLFAMAGGPSVAGLAAASLTVSAGLYALIRAREAREPSRPGGQIRVGIQFLWGLRKLRGTVLIGSMAVGMSGLVTASGYAVVDEGLHRPAAFLGVLTASQGAGSVLGGLLTARLLARRGERWVARAGACLFAAGLVVRCLPWTPVVLAGSVLGGIGLPATVIAAMTAVQRLTPPALLGRVAATATTLVFASPAFGIPLGAALVLVLDYRVVMLAAAAGAALSIRFGHDA
jgi:MFS family permease